MDEQQINYLATYVITDKRVSIKVIKNHLGVPSTVCEFNRNDAIEETLNEEYTQEVLRSILDYKIDNRASYEADLIEYTKNRINDWHNDGYTLEIVE